MTESSSSQADQVEKWCRETIVSLLVHRVRTDGERPALHFHDGERFQALSWNDLAKHIATAASVLIELGVQPGDRVVQVSENRVEWIVCDFAIQLAQAIHIPIHASLTGPQVAFQINDCSSRVVLLSDDVQAAKLAPAAKDWENGPRIISFDQCKTKIGEKRIDSLNDVAGSIEASDFDALADAALGAVTPDSIATILYTSGTTGEPKGVVLTQRNLAFNTLATLEVFGQQPEDTRLGFLPLSHIFARTCDLYTWIARNSQLALARSRETVLEDCALIKPTLINGVPYFFEKVQRYLIDNNLADKPGSLQQLLGGEIRLCCSGGAALPDHVHDFYHERELPVLQGYGLTETSPAITVSSQEQYCRGSVGPPIPGVEIQIAEDGEILTRGPHVMVGYYKDPQATDEVIRDGWFSTGDLGHLDEDGFLHITGRKKELIVTATGKNIAPVYIESLLTEDPLIIQALVIGDDRKYLTALLVPDPDHLKAEIKARKIRLFSKKQALTHPQVVELYQQRIQQCLKDVAPSEQVRNFKLLDRGFTIESGEMTAKLTLRREVIQANFASVIEAMYADGKGNS